MHWQAVGAIAAVITVVQIPALAVAGRIRTWAQSIDRRLARLEHRAGLDRHD